MPDEEFVDEGTPEQTENSWFEGDGEQDVTQDPTDNYSLDHTDYSTTESPVKTFLQKIRWW